MINLKVNSLKLRDSKVQNTKFCKTKEFSYEWFTHMPSVCLLTPSAWVNTSISFHLFGSNRAILGSPTRVTSISFQTQFAANTSGSSGFGNMWRRRQRWPSTRWPTPDILHTCARARPGQCYHNIHPSNIFIWKTPGHPLFFQQTQ